MAIFINLLGAFPRPHRLRPGGGSLFCRRNPLQNLNDLTIKISLDNLIL